MPRDSAVRQKARRPAEQLVVERSPTCGLPRQGCARAEAIEQAREERRRERTKLQVTHVVIWLRYTKSEIATRSGSATPSRRRGKR